ncbi:HK97 family phage prohead protease [Proteus mirabilis]|uniref:HK97 family phage prohead protease n=1 Tax=Proteus mirabilis TaxID=584 RepID=UPI0013D17976|nr:HK97 family phage prohead protease [Proteus mirabilis]EKT8411870.1 HK97 family phage prohead protease [Proteus mirabilis]EKU7616835.1 HK97 family phage prohead protease [Proteus mirabilis]ELI0195342.1 HK97 family phage prohead protease [Proteus mirabilis]ELT7778998.1 HK97 family phage prohead protease [Proteus mirabilis]MBG2830298.1 HK97 family phage prohead protease [Proteus mirabilis]
MNNTDLEIRTATLSANNQKLVGYVIKWNHRSHVLWDEFTEQFAPDAFKASLQSGHDVRALYEHDHTNLLGRTTSGTLQLSEDTTGLRFELTPPDTQLGRDVLTLVERGDISGMSFGFRTIKDQWDIGQEPYVRTVLEAELHEITITSLPAYPDSGVEIAKRSLTLSKPQAVKDFDRWLQLAEVE